MTIRTLLVFCFWVWSSSSSFAQDGRELVGPRYATAGQCSAVLKDLNTAANRSTLALSMATQVCYVSRLGDHVARQIALQRDQDDAPPGTRRSADTNMDDRWNESELQALADSLHRARDRRDELLDDFVQSDPHEANDLLKRLLGPGNEKRG